MRRIFFCLILMALSAFFLLGYYSQQSADDVEQSKSFTRHARVSRAIGDGEIMGLQRITTRILARPKGPKSKCPGGATLIVDSVKGPYFNIQEAVNAASDGDRIKVKAGTYSGFAVEDFECLTIEGQGMEDVIVSGSIECSDTCRGTEYATVFVNNSTQIYLKKLTIVGGDDDNVVVWFASSTGVVEYCDVSGTAAYNRGHGIRIEGCESESIVDVRHCTIHDFGRVGIWVSSYFMLSPQSTARIEHNNITGRFIDSPNRIQDGVVIDFTYAYVKSNIIRDCQGSLIPEWSSNGIVVFQSKADIKDNRLFDNQVGIATDAYRTGPTEPVLYTPEIYAKGNRIENNIDTGIFLINSENSVIENTWVTGSEFGVYQANYDDLYGDQVTSEVISYFRNCDLRGNTTDVFQDPWFGDCTLYFKNVKYDTYEFYSPPFASNLYKE